MQFPEQLKYTKDHEWLEVLADGTTRIGVSAYAVDSLGDIVFVELPPKGKNLKTGEAFGTIESTKTVSDLYAPAKGAVVSHNQEVIDNPEGVNKDPYGAGWLLQIKLEGELPSELMDATHYQNYIKG